MPCGRCPADASCWLWQERIDQGQAGFLVHDVRTSEERVLSSTGPARKWRAEERRFWGAGSSTRCKRGIDAERFASSLGFKGDTAFLELGDTRQSELTVRGEDIWRQRPDVSGYLPEDCSELLTGRSLANASLCSG